ncbi:hypothetical protein LMH87_005313 [Akanthomyces muscarius]|uniref:Rhodopsin domain-containing protein n=1 Tax=Akanthomyces muscarius TaxID=2231603 RepID=A0A9W8QKG5_AKAMU|nr:hypothetical protein LMH87_005313 [Akanthomyces muscarius]KAJ4163593.1 hypothetical protein LMH87_005313 [Akanthomyces muscarius]
MPAFPRLDSVSAQRHETQGMAALLPRDSAQDAFQKVVIEAWTLLATALAITALRIGFRISALGIRNLGWDDYLVCIGAIFYVAETTLAFSVGHVAHGLANGGMTDEARAALSPNDPEYKLRVIGSQIQIAGWTTYGTMLWLYKTCMLIYYMRLTSGLHKSYKRQIYLGFALLGSTYLVLGATVFLSCRPFHKYWQIYPDPGNACQPALSIQIIWMNLALNASTDLYLMSIPVPMLWKSGLKLSRKIASTILFTSGAFVVVCALLRSILITIDPINGPQTAGVWGVRESFVATVVTNLPIIFPRLKVLFKRHLTPILSLRSSRSGHSATGFRTIGGGDGNGGAGVRHRRNPPQSVYPLPTKLTVTQSAEQLVDEGIELQSGKSPAPSERATGEPQSTRATTASARDTEASVSGSACAERGGP